MVLDSAEWIDSIEIKSLDSMEVVKNSLIDPKIEDDSLGISLLDSNLISSDIQNLVMFNQEETIDIANKMESDSIIVNYLIKKNETLFSISNKFYNEYNNWNEIYKLNKEILINPSYLVPYNRINILLPKNQSDSLVVSLEFDEYIVKEHDSLWKIAKEQYGDPLAWIIIYKDNLRTIGFLPDEISAGMRFNIRRNIFSLYITPL